MEQMQEVYADSSLIEEALADATAENGHAVEGPGRRLAGVRQQLAGARRSLDRYFAAFEEGLLSPADCQERIAKLKVRIDALSAGGCSLSASRRGITGSPVPWTSRSGRGTSGRSSVREYLSSARRCSVRS